MDSKKLYYTMGEVSELFCVAPSLIRYWEKNFSAIKPMRNKKGNRLFTPEDIENFKMIYHLVKERGMTLEGAQRTMKQSKKSINRDAELLEGLQKIRALLLEVREELKDDVQTIACDDESDDDTTIEIDIADDDDTSTPTLGEPIDHSARHTKRTPDAESKELFAFYEQSLF